MQTARVVVIGSGPAGAIAARTLCDAGIPVTILESGGMPPRGFRLRAGGIDVATVLPGRAPPVRHVAPDDPSTVWHCELTAGGLSNWWAGTSPRFAPEDFTEGERLDARYRWPVDYSDLVPYYERVEALMPVSGTREDVPCVPACVVARARTLPRDWQHVDRASARSGGMLIPRPVAGARRFEVTTRATTFNSFSDLLARGPRPADLEIVLGAHALRIEHDGGARPRATAVIYRERASGAEHRLPAAAVVVAAGALASTQLLLASTSRAFPEGFGNTDDVLGRYLHDHPSSTTYIRVSRPLTRIPAGAYLTRAPYEGAEPLRAVGTAIGSVRFLRSLALRRPGVFRTHDIACTWFGTVIPEARNTARLHAERVDDFGLPWLEIRLAPDPVARAMLASTRDHFLASLDAAGHTGEVVRETPRPTGDSVHYGGTIRMHASPRFGMLDGFNRMHAVRNVVVADSAAFTTGAEKNPTLTMMALSARAAAKLAVDLRAGEC